MAYNIKPILEEVRFIRPKNLFEYILYYPVPSVTDEIVMYKIFFPLFLRDDVINKLSDYEWYYYITHITTDFPLPLTDTYNYYEPSNVINDYIFNNYAYYEFLPKITDLFTYDHFTIRDRNMMRTFVNGIVGNVLLKNAEKYEKLFKAMTLEFNPLWNVDGTETTIRTLERDGTETTRRTGTTSDSKTGTETTQGDTSDVLERTGTDTNRKSGTESIQGTESKTDSKTGTETTKHTGTDNHVKNGQETKETATDKSAFNSNTQVPTETVTETTQYTNVSDNETKDLTDTVTHNTTDTISGNTTDTTTYNTTDTETLDTQDARTIENSETVTHNTTDTITHNTQDATTLDTTDTENITVTRQGNIGVTTTTKLLTEYVDFAKYVDFVKEISHDIVSELCYMT